MTLIKSKKSVLAFSSDSTQNQVCKSCKKLLPECQCHKKEEPVTKIITAVLKIEKKGRGGKTVTMIEKLPRNEDFLKNLTAVLKNKCGSGGTYYQGDKEGTIEIQGDKREQIRQILSKEGIKIKG